tara:strand:- start:673 stop:864 length:192 start_codon:yes stop_codon:yes gene_type:complete
MKTFHLLLSRQHEGEWTVAHRSGARYKIVLWWLLVDIIMMQINGVEKVVYVPIDENERGGWGL